ncbi:MAG: DUF1838 domain-containing protein [Gammaproteobacteria bacterium]|nr:DUF1838 domain-containing protein [Gammaproteobacteria bacterium]
MKKKNSRSFYQHLSRRAALAGLAMGGVGLMAGTARAAKAPRIHSLDLDDPADNCRALIKLQADLCGKEAMGGFPGTVWAWIPGEGNRLLFNTYGVGVSRVEWREDENAWRFYHREALLYLDPKSGDVLESWYNPWTERQVEVLHILNDHVNRLYSLAPGARFTFPWPYEVNGDDIVLRISVFRFEDNVMDPKLYPLHSQDAKYQTTELWGMIGSLSEVRNPDVTSAHCVTSWARISGWQPFMEMGNRPGQTVYHSHSYKLMKGPAQIPQKVRGWLEKKAPEYLEAPKEWTPPSESIGVWNYSKRLIDERRAKGLAPGQTPFAWPRS